MARFLHVSACFGDGWNITCNMVSVEADQAISWCATQWGSGGDWKTWWFHRTGMLLEVWVLHKHMADEFTLTWA